MKFFKVQHKSKKSKARLGEIKTDHGIIKTPAFVAVGTKGTVKALTPDILEKIGTQAAFVNTYHLVAHPGPDAVAAAGGIHKYSGLNLPLMSDSGGFQVFSLARKDKSKIQNKADIRGEEKPLLVKISEDGVKFRSTHDGALMEFTPEKSMEYQREIGADINMAFDECTYYPATRQYAEKAMDRTHMWLKRCLVETRRWRIEDRRSDLEDGRLKMVEKRNMSTIYPQTSENYPLHSTSYRQYLYGVIQGGTFEDLRKKSARHVVEQNTLGVAIGGVSVGETKKEIREQVKWVSDYLPSDRPVHLLGVGQIDDVIDLVKYGIDTFDCVEPTRLARMGQIYQLQQILSRIPSRQGSTASRISTLSGALLPRHLLQFELDITKSVYKNNLEPVDASCNCYTCRNFTKSYLHHLFKMREILGYTLATIHNLAVMENLFGTIRQMITENII